MSIVINENAASLRKQIQSIAGAQGKLDDRIHAAAVSALWHADKYGDVTLLSDIVRSMPAKGSRRKQLTGWALAFGRVRPQNDASSPVLFRVDKKGELCLQDAIDCPWYEWQPANAEPKEAAAYDVDAAAKRLLAAVDKHSAERGVQVSDAVADALNTLRLALAQHS